MEFRVDGYDLRCTSLEAFVVVAAAAAAAASALLAARAFALVACGGVDTTTSGAVTRLSSAAASSNRGFGFNGLLLEVRDLFDGCVAGVEIEAGECGVVAIEAGLFGFMLFIFAHSADSYVNEDHAVGRFGV